MSFLNLITATLLCWFFLHFYFTIYTTGTEDYHVLLDRPQIIDNFSVSTGDRPILKIKEKNAEVFLEDTLQLTTFNNTDKTVVWSSSDESIATVKDGLVTPKTKGKVSITASLEEDATIFDVGIITVVLEQKIASSKLSAVADSEENVGGDGPASYAVDGNESTMWHSAYSGGKVNADIPNNINNSITIDLGDTHLINKFEYLPRQSGGNGNILEYELWYSTSDDGEDFIQVPGETESWAPNSELKTARFMPVEARRLRLRAMKTQDGSGGNKWISAREFYVYRTLETTDIKFDLTVENGTGSGKYAKGDTVTISATIPADKKFDRWTSDDVVFTDPEAQNTSFEMPSKNVRAVATFKDITVPDPDEYALTVVAQTGGKITVGTNGSHKEGEKINLTATADEGYKFTGWASSNGGTFADPTGASTTFTMPKNQTTVTAKFQKVVVDPDKYALTVVAQTGGKITVGTNGSHKEGEKINLTATADEGYKFTGWASSNGGTFADPTGASTTFTMPKNQTTVTAKFQKTVVDPEPKPPIIGPSRPTNRPDSGGSGGTSIPDRDKSNQILADTTLPKPVDEKIVLNEAKKAASGNGYSEIQKRHYYHS